MKALLFSKNSHPHTGLLLFRMIIGLGLMYHGYGKIINPDKWFWLGSQTPFIEYLPYFKKFFGFMASFSEFFGGLGLFLGFFTKPAALLISATMFVACHFHYMKGEGFELPLIYGLCSFSLFISGPGRHSADTKIN